MPDRPTITAILTAPGLDTTQGHGSSKDVSTPEVVLVGVVVDDRQVTWGRCVVDPRFHDPNYPAQFTGDEVKRTLISTVVPALRGRPLASFRQISTLIDTLSEQATVVRPVSQDEKPASGVSRREIISGFLAAPASTPFTEKVDVERKVHPALRYGLSQALLTAVARVEGLSNFELLLKEFDLPVLTGLVDLHMPIRRGQALRLYPQVSSLGYTPIPGRSGSDPALDPIQDPALALGQNAERVQRFVRQLRERLVEARAEHPMSLYLDFHGGLGRLHGNNLGLMLGTLYGLEQAAKPCPLVVADVVHLDDLREEIKILRQLKEYVRLRGMSTRIAACAPISTMEALEMVVESGAVDLIHISAPRLGSLAETVAAVEFCRAYGTAALLEGHLPEFLAPIALATHPEWATLGSGWPAEAGVIALQNEMTRTMTWMSYLHADRLMETGRSSM